MIGDDEVEEAGEAGRDDSGVSGTAVVIGGTVVSGVVAEDGGSGVVEPVLVGAADGGDVDDQEEESGSGDVAGRVDTVDVGDGECGRCSPSAG